MGKKLQDLKSSLPDLIEVDESTEGTEGVEEKHTGCEGVVEEKLEAGNEQCIQDGSQSENAEPPVGSSNDKKLSLACTKEESDSEDEVFMGPVITEKEKKIAHKFRNRRRTLDDEGLPSIMIISAEEPVHEVAVEKPLEQNDLVRKNIIAGDDNKESVEEVALEKPLEQNDLIRKNIIAGDDNKESVGEVALEKPLEQNDLIRKNTIAGDDNKESVEEVAMEKQNDLVRKNIIAGDNKKESVEEAVISDDPAVEIEATMKDSKAKLDGQRSDVVSDLDLLQKDTGNSASSGDIANLGNDEKTSIGADIEKSFGDDQESQKLSIEVKHLRLSLDENIDSKFDCANGKGCAEAKILSFDSPLKSQNLEESIKQPSEMVKVEAKASEKEKNVSQKVKLPSPSKSRIPLFRAVAKSGKSGDMPIAGWKIAKDENRHNVRNSKLKFCAVDTEQDISEIFSKAMVLDIKEPTPSASDKPFPFCSKATTVKKHLSPFKSSKPLPEPPSLLGRRPSEVKKNMKLQSNMPVSKNSDIQSNIEQKRQALENIRAQRVQMEEKLKEKQKEKHGEILAGLKMNVLELSLQNNPNANPPCASESVSNPPIQPENTENNNSINDEANLLHTVRENTRLNSHYNYCMFVKKKKKHEGSGAVSGKEGSSNLTPRCKKINFRDGLEKSPGPHFPELKEPLQPNLKKVEPLPRDSKLPQGNASNIVEIETLPTRRRMAELAYFQKINSRRRPSTSMVSVNKKDS
eukprot:Nk52_evm13s490 gene=Nk52_evmTU13s490